MENKNMIREYFIAHDEHGFYLFDSKPHLQRVVLNPVHWEWVDEERKRGLFIGMGNCLKNFREIPINSYIKLIDFGEDTIFYPTRKI